MKKDFDDMDFDDSGFTSDAVWLIACAIGFCLPMIAAVLSAS